MFAGPTDDAADTLTPAQRRLVEMWEEHLKGEFTTHNTDDTLATMVEDAYVNHVPVLTGKWVAGGQPGRVGQRGVHTRLESFQCYS